jgi:hypothetical protein
VPETVSLPFLLPLTGRLLAKKSMISMFFCITGCGIVAAAVVGRAIICGEKYPRIPEETLPRPRIWSKSSSAEGFVVTERERSSFAMSVSRSMKIPSGGRRRGCFGYGF